MIDILFLAQRHVLWLMTFLFHTRIPEVCKTFLHVYAFPGLYWVNNNQVLKNVFHSEALRKYLWATFLAPNDRDKASLGSYCVNYVLVSAETGISIHLNVKNDYLKPMKRISCTPQDILKNRHPKCYHFKSKVSTGKRIPALYFYPRVQHWTPVLLRNNSKKL